MYLHIALVLGPTRFTLFRFSASSQYALILNSRFLIFGFMPFGWLRSVTQTLTCFITSYGNITVDLRAVFQEHNYGVKQRLGVNIYVLYIHGGRSENMFTVHRPVLWVIYFQPSKHYQAQFYWQSITFPNSPGHICIVPLEELPCVPSHSVTTVFRFASICIFVTAKIFHKRWKDDNCSAANCRKRHHN